jgi:hypothetical protein
MPTGRHSFKHNDAARLIRAAMAAGLAVKGVRLKDGAVTVLIEDDPAQGDEPNDWAGVLKDAPDEKRST